MFFAIILYGALTVAGLFPFHGIPILNIALGFPLGAWAAYYAQRAHRQTAGSGPEQAANAGDARLAERAVLRTVLAWSLATSGLTMILCWFQLAFFLLTIRFIGPAPEILRWIPLVHPSQGLGLFPSQSFANVQLFAILLAPGIQVLTTVFGGVVGLLLLGRTQTPPHTSPAAPPRAPTAAPLRARPQPRPRPQAQPHGPADDPADDPRESHF